MDPLLSVTLSADYPGKPEVLRDVTFDLEAGEILGLVGESGSGKSTLALAILGLLPYKGGSMRGSIRFRGEDLVRLKERELRRLRGRQIALVLQSAASSLNPALRLGTQFKEAWRSHESGPEWKRRTLELLERVSLPASEQFLDRYPKQVSVGQAQRVLIAMAVLHQPALLVADEPTSALDAITSAEVLALLRQLNRDLTMAMLFISHDLLSIASISHRVAILQKGEIVETGSVAHVFAHPAHPYTRSLRAAWLEPYQAIRGIASPDAA